MEFVADVSDDELVRAMFDPDPVIARAARVLYGRRRAAVPGAARAAALRSVFRGMPEMPEMTLDEFLADERAWIDTESAIAQALESFTKVTGRTVNGVYVLNYGDGRYQVGLHPGSQIAAKIRSGE